ncbi:helix-hairpin-helix domain-containing protein [Halalkalicoccus ordinarius]|uniref:helix-hairpin-helix domain-containing protein n=1 Tax=Halalkalicoccus ordinarius TaxID=3116651 RepID=UPI00300F2A9B
MRTGRRTHERTIDARPKRYNTLTMTNATTPIQAAFEMQRESIKQTQQLFEQSLELQQNALEAFMHNGISAQRSAQKQGTELFQQLANAQYDAIESAVDEDEIRSAVDEQFEQNARLTQQLLNAQFEQGAELIQQLFNAQYDAVESAVDDEQFRSAMNSQLYDFEAAQEEAWDEFESEFVAAFKELGAQQQRVVAQSVDTFLDAQQDAEQQTIQGVQQAQNAAQTAQQQTQQVAETAQQQGEQVAQTVQQQTQQVAESAAEGAEEIAEESAEAAEQQTEVQVDAAEDVASESADVDIDVEDEDDGQELESIEGLGPTYADRLRQYGIQSVEHLAQADGETVADAAEISEERAGEWITSAQSQA